MSTTVSDYAPGDLRVSDADRDRAISELSEAFQAGRLTADEFDDRSSQALRARTGAELACLVADLPHGQPSIALAAAVALIGTHGGQRGFAGLIPLLVVLFVVLRHRRR